MASFTCHVFCVTKRIRLERLVRPPLPGTCARSATAQPLSGTVQQVLPESLAWHLARAEPRMSTRAAKNSHRIPPEADSAGRILRRVAPARSRGGSRPTADAAHRACEVQMPWMSEMLEPTLTLLPTVRGTRPNNK